MAYPYMNYGSQAFFCNQPDMDYLLTEQAKYYHNPGSESNHCRILGKHPLGKLEMSYLI